jgi:hypothetical protein
VKIAGGWGSFNRVLLKLELKELRRG